MDIADLHETARLAHLNLDEGELAGAFPAFEQMLGFFAAMQAADADGGAFGGEGAIRAEGAGVPGSRGNDPPWTADSRHFRPDQGGDEPHPSPSRGLNENLLNNAGERDGRFIVVPNVL
jgi:aspartyl-tRNA(Asn)/glutamyl-tRNA(Gln) amidotransferase subunit C